ncbi:MAG: hypothetical protein JW774_08755 [Candidatus Aureabacteria bacterium]|nr:hypothetical protein [Candidatus Auribacterota bacterium]
MNHKWNVAGLLCGLTVFFSFSGFVLSDESRQEALSVISEFREKIRMQSGEERENTKRQMERFHKRQLASNRFDDQVRWAFIQDDLRYGNAEYAVPLLQDINTPDAILKLMEMHSDPFRQGKTIRIHRLTLKGFEESFFRKEEETIRYEFSVNELPRLFAQLDQSKLTEDQKTRLYLVNHCQFKPKGLIRQYFLEQRKRKEKKIKKEKKKPVSVQQIPEDRFSSSVPQTVKSEPVIPPETAGPVPAAVIEPEPEIPSVQPEYMEIQEERESPSVLPIESPPSDLEIREETIPDSMTEDTSEKTKDEEALDLAKKEADAIAESEMGQMKQEAAEAAARLEAEKNDQE